MNFKIFRLGIGIAAAVVCFSGITKADPGLQGVSISGLMPLSTSIVLSSAVAQNTGDNPYARQLAASGNSLYTVGSVMAWGGLIASLSGNLIGAPELAMIGSLALNIGLPIMGVGAGKISAAAGSINSEGYQDPGSGWGWYIAGWALQGVGIAMLFANIDDLVQTDPSTGIQTFNGDALILPIVFLLAGSVSFYVSWYKFSKRKDFANMAIASLDIKPVIRLGEHGSTAFGGQLALHF